MRIKALLIPQRTKGNITIVGSYRDRKNDKEVFLLGNGTKVVSSLEEKDRVFQHTFESNYPLKLSFDEFDFADKTIIEFWKNHPLVFTDGYTNPNLVSEQFKFEIKEEKVKVEFEALTSKLSCVSCVSNMNDMERRDLSFALGSDPRDMTSKEVYLHLIGLTLNGIAVAKRDIVSTFLQVRNIERTATIYANKAVQFGIVKKEGSIFKIGGRNLGTEVESVISTILSDTDMFENYIKPEVDKYEKDELSQIQTLGNDLELPKELENLIPILSATEKKRASKS